MEACKFFILIFLIFTFIDVHDGKFTSKICNHDKPYIHFPFKVNSFCKNNITMINFRRYGDLGVKSISYEPEKKLTLIDPNDCVFEVFMNLDLSSTPFQYYHVVKNYTYFNCSVKLSGSFEQVPCLSGSKHHVYVEATSLDVPSSCKTVKTVSIPFAYSSYISDDSFGLDLKWDSARFIDIGDDKTGWLGLQFIREELSIAVLVFAVVGLACVKAYYSKKSHSKEYEWDKLLGDLETL
ncbi:putative RING-H2 finger protein ATL21A [Rutidosis leptorrhynchoides]|uniref:putative RING-H2 finger protein ATL21A n=1 Tax=Rutidosis leptorrhynchoides TaxID=125765 RepID=UPI003A98DB28